MWVHLNIWTTIRSEIGLVSVILLSGLLTGCAAGTPSKPDDACTVFEEQPRWRQSTQHAFQRWGVPVHVQLAIVHQESRFRSDARPPRKRFLGIIPTGRRSSAYGYGQALDGTWEWYIQRTGNRGADRDDFSDVVDFIGWYGNFSHTRLGIARGDAYHQYLAYHEGHRGFAEQRHRAKPWLLAAARRVQQSANRYARQLTTCG